MPEKKRLWNMWVTAILIVVNALGTVLKGLEKELEIRGRIETIQTTAELKSTRLGRVLETCCHPDSKERPRTNAGEKKQFKSIKSTWILRRDLETYCHPDFNERPRTNTGEKKQLKLIKSTRIMRRVLETWCPPDSNERPQTNAGEKNSQGVI